MSAPPYMPFYVGDYLADTTHLTTTEHGAYLLLLATMWRAGGSLPNDDGKLARFARLTPAQWSRIKGAIISFFDVKDEVITQGRLAHEMERYSKAVKQRRDAGSRGGTAKALKTRENIVADATVSLNQPEPEPEPEKGNKDIPLLIGGLKNERRPDLRRIATDNRRGAWAGAIAERNGSAGDGNEAGPRGYGLGDSGGEGDRPVAHSRKAGGNRAGD